jgi:hypothetical protein
MLYLEKDDGRGIGWSRVFSTTDSQRELDRFRCTVRAPRQALHVKKSKRDRVYLLLFGKPRETALLMIPIDFGFATPVERAIWESKQPEIAKKYPVPFMSNG